MGIMYSSAAFLAQAKMKGVRFDRILTIGHLTSYLTQKQIKQLAERYARKMDSAELARQQYADELFKVFLNARTVQSLDYSDHEGCDILHDMNYPVDPRYHENFDVVIDGGSLEHIFNFPVAITNCMNMVKKGGSLFMVTMTNNHAGHGFYQFSPELFFRIFQPQNGFEVREIVLEKHPYPGPELSPRTACFSVADPALVKSRVGLVSRDPVIMMIHAVRSEIKPLFASYPIQSDYAATYAVDADAAVDRNAPGRPLWKKIGRTLYDLLPMRWRNSVVGRRQRMLYSFSNRRFYKKWRPL